MTPRFVEATKEAEDLMMQVKSDYFPALVDAQIKILFDTKMRKKGNKIVLGRILKSNDLVRKLTDSEVEEGYDYIMFLDEVAFENLENDDRVRLIRHELRHCKVVGTPEKPKYKLVPHDIEDFVVEIELNKDKIEWAKKAVELVSEIYYQMEDDKKDKEGKDK